MKGLKKWTAFLIALTLLVSSCISVLAAPEVGEDCTFDDLSRFTEYYFDEFFRNRDIWEREDGESMDPKDIPEGQEFVSKTYVDAFKEKADELWAVGDAGEDAIKEFDVPENKDARRELYQALKERAEALDNNVETGTRPAVLDSLYTKMDKAWDLVNSLTDSYGDVEDEDNSAKNVHVIWLEEEETVDEEFIKEMNAEIPGGHYWILGDDWMNYWQGSEAMDWILETLNDCGAKLEKAENAGSWDELDGLSGTIDKAADRAQEMRRYLESHLYPRPEPGKQEASSQAEESRGEAKDKQETPLPERTANQVKGSDGREIVSTLAGVYSAQRINGLAVITGKEQAEAAAGLQTAGSRLSMYTSDVSENKEIVSVMSDAARLLGAYTACSLQIDLYEIEGNRVNAVRNTQEPLRLVLELPRNMINASHTFSILVPDGIGGVLEMKDLDQDPATITIDATVFGMWTIIYR